MKKKTLALLLTVGVFAASIVQSCKKDSTTTTTQTTTTPSEFIAKDSSFIDFMSWPNQATNNGPSPSLGMAHAGNDSTVVRRIYFKDGQSSVSGQYPVGTIIVKHSTNPAGTVNEFTAMVKRGNNFNPTKGNWEFFMLNTSGVIAKESTGMAMRGASLMGGMCGGCHAQVSSKDYIFSK